MSPVPARRVAVKKTKYPKVGVERHDVLDAAAELFLTNGYYRTRMQDIAEPFGVTHAALYYHFKNKQDILAQIHLRACEDLLAGAEEILATDDSTRDKLLAIIRRHMSRVAHAPGLIATFLEHDLEIPRRQFRSIAKCRREYTDIIRGLYEEARDAGAVPDADSTIAVSLILGACNWIYRWYLPDGKLTPEQVVEQSMLILSKLFEPDN